MPAEATKQKKFWREQARVETNSKLYCHPWQYLGANIASSSYRTQGMGTVSKLAAGFSSDLLESASDVQLKEGGKLILVPREIPLSLINLRNLTEARRSRSKNCPGNPGLV